MSATAGHTHSACLIYISLGSQIDLIDRFGPNRHQLKKMRHAPPLAPGANQGARGP